MAFKIDYSNSDLNKNLDKMAVKLGALILMYASTKASKLQSTMQKNRPWRDRTGMAKATLRGTVSRPKGDLIRITLSHGVSYGIWLELAHEKRFAIIGPTIKSESPKVMSEMQGILNKIKL